MATSARLQTASEFHAEQARLVASGVVAVRRVQGESLGTLERVMLALRLLLFRRAVAAVPAMLAEQGVSADPVATPTFGPLAAVASDGRPMRSLLDLARSQNVNLDRIVATQLQDTGRMGESLATAVRPRVSGYVRMLNLPSCSRCIQLAGRVYRWNSGFQRHPLCDCVHIPTTEDAAGDLRTDPRLAFESMTPEQQDRSFGKAGAEAVRDGADVSQVVNARRGGVQTAQMFGRELLTTATGRPRLMPESIYRIADDRADAIRLLTRFGYIR